MTSSFLCGATVATFSVALFFMSAPGTAQIVQTDKEAAHADSAGHEAMDPFDGFSSFTEADLATFSGGASLDLGDIAVNLSDQTAGISDTSMTGQFENGRISGNMIEQLSGINSLMFNTGNNVNFQSSIQINVFVK